MGKELSFKGVVNGQLVSTGVQNTSNFPMHSDQFFSMELKEDLLDTPLKAGDTVVVIVSSRNSRIYIRIGDAVEVVGKVEKTKIKRREGDFCYYITSKGILNETLKFTLAY